MTTHHVVVFPFRKKVQNLLMKGQYLGDLYVVKKGFTLIKENDKSRQNKVRKTIKVHLDCLAFIIINRVLDLEEWVVGLVVANHNHGLEMPIKCRYLHTNRKIPNWVDELFQSLKFSNVAQSKQFAIVSIDCGGYENMTFSQSNFET